MASAYKLLRMKIRSSCNLHSNLRLLSAPESSPRNSFQYLGRCSSFESYTTSTTPSSKMPFVREAASEAPTPKVTGLDHLVLTVKDLNETVSFYSKALGFSVVTFGEGRLALKYGSQKINLHAAGREYKPHAEAPTPGSADLCFVTTTSIPEWITHLNELQIPIVEGPVQRTGATGPILSIYVRDPDLNLIELGYYI